MAFKINNDKSNVMHFRNKRVNRTEKTFKMGNLSLEIVEEYRYLGIVINEHLKFEHTSTILSEAAGRALGGVISKFKMFKNVGFRTFSKLYHSSVTSVMDYASGVWGWMDEWGLTSYTTPNGLLRTCQRPGR